MVPLRSEAEILRNILDNIHNPELLDVHSWVSRPFVQDIVERNEQLKEQRPGQQLTAALAELFSDIKPSAPPRRGKRLDTRWGEFGLLAALYFGPFQFGTPIPSSLRDAWGRIDQSILLYVYGSSRKSLSQGEIDAYKLVGDEPEVAPISTLSDWHCKGIQRLADSIPTRENFLKQSSAANSSSELPLLPSTAPSRDNTYSESIGKKLNRLRKAVRIGLTLITLVALISGGRKVQQIYRLLTAVQADLSQLQQLNSSGLDLKRLAELDAPLAKSRKDFDVLLDEVEPMLWLGPGLGWVPVYGGDLASSREILQMADLFLKSTETAHSAFQPLLTTLNSENNFNPSQIVALLSQVQPELIQARQAFDQAKQLRAGLNLDKLSPRTRTLIERDLDQLMPMMDDGLDVAMTLPRLLGAANNGPQTYLLLAQNEDELRPTGGFLTAVGRLVVQNGQVVHMSFVDSGELDNWDLPYPAAPWQLSQYMNSPVLVLRDANWFTDFPTSALSVESLYAYKYSHSVNGIIAFDQYMLVLMLKAIGPIEVEGEQDLISANNVIDYMRSSKVWPSDQPVATDWSRKAFMDKITSAMFVKLFEGKDISWQKLAAALYQGLNQHHVLLQFDEPTITEVTARRHWDGALRYESGDFLMAVDSNVGFNKTNALVETSLSYDADLTNVENPIGQLTVFHHNNAASEVECIHWRGQRLRGEEHYPVNDCYWNYMRVYAPPGTELIEASPQRIPAEWMISNREVNGQVDILDDEVPNLQGFGTLMVVPGGQSAYTSFQFRLPDSVLVRDGKHLIYRLSVEKQPGTVAVPLTIRIHFPNGATVESSSPEVVLEGNHLLIESDLRTDFDLFVNFVLK